MKISDHVMTLLVLSMTAAVAGMAASTGLNPSPVFANTSFLLT